MKIFKVNFRSHFRHLWLLLFLVFFVPVGLYVLILFRYGVFEPDKFLIALVIVLLLFFLPLILLHTNYYLYSRGVVFWYDKTQGVMIYKNREKDIRFCSKDMVEVICYKSWPMAEDRNLIFPWDIYNYASIKLKDGRVIKLSSLVVYEFDKSVNLTDIKIKKTFYPWISREL